MGYESSTACLVLTTHCVVCNRPLVDATSVEVCIGPVCREKVGYNTNVSEDDREQANGIINSCAHEIANGKVTHETVERTEILREIGFPRVADIIVARCSSIIIEEDTSTYIVRCPFSPQFNTASKCKGRYGIKKTTELSNRKVFHWVFPKSQKKTLFKALIESYEGQLAKGPRGSFIVTHPRKS